MDRHQFHLLLLDSLPPVHQRNLGHFSCFPHNHPRQCLVNSCIVLDNRQIRPSSSPHLVIAIVGDVVGFNHTHIDAAGRTIANNISAVNAQIAFICIYIFFFASTWGPGGWVVTGEIFPIPIRSHGIALSIASNWFWNTIIAVITPYLVREDKGNLKSNIFFLWGSICTCAVFYAYFLVPKTKGLTLEQVDRLFEETTPRTSAKWKPTTTFATEMGVKDGHLGTRKLGRSETAV